MNNTLIRGIATALGAAAIAGSVGLGGLVPGSVPKAGAAPSRAECVALVGGATTLGVREVLKSKSAGLGLAVRLGYKTVPALYSTWDQCQDVSLQDKDDPCFRWPNPRGFLPR